MLHREHRAHEISRRKGKARVAAQPEAATDSRQSVCLDSARSFLIWEETGRCRPGRPARAFLPYGRRRNEKRWSGRVAGDVPELQGLRYASSEHKGGLFDGSLVPFCNPSSLSFPLLSSAVLSCCLLVRPLFCFEEVFFLIEINTCCTLLSHVRRITTTISCVCSLP